MSVFSGEVHLILQAFFGQLRIRRCWGRQISACRQRQEGKDSGGLHFSAFAFSLPSLCLFQLAPGNDCDDVDILLCPGTIQKSDVLFSPKDIASCNGQPGYGNFFRCKSCRHLAGSNTRIDRSDLLEALTSGSFLDCSSGDDQCVAKRMDFLVDFGRMGNRAGYLLAHER